MTGVWWDEQLAGTGSAGGVPAVHNARQPVPTAPHTRRGGPARGVAIVGDEWTRWWNYACTTARQLAAGIEPPGIEVYGPVLASDEDALLSADLSYGRLYGGVGQYRKSDLLVIGRPAVMAGAFALSAVINHRRKVAARREAELRWRDHQRVQVYVTTDRLLCDTDTGWLSCWYGSVIEFYPDLQSWSLTVGLDQGTAPVWLSGPAAPAVCLWAAKEVLGDRWIGDPRLAPLLR